MFRLALVLAAAAALLAGCGGDDQTEQSDAPQAELFADNCGSCHTFGPAGATGKVGPPLDNTPLDAAAISSQIENGGGGMPPAILEGDEREDVARWIAANAGS